MPLRFDVCALCSESHALTGHGAMSIHTTAAGARCPGALAGSEARTSTVDPRDSPETQARVDAAVTRKARKADLLKKVPAKEVDSELAAAFEVARYRRQRSPEEKRQLKPAANPYVTKTTYVVSGGLPTLGRRSR